MSAADPAEVAALRAVAGAARNAVRTGGFPELTDALAALDAVRPAESDADRALKLYGRGNSYRQIADQMGITLGQARRLVLQAREGQS